MKVSVHVKTNSKIEGITQSEDGNFVVRVNSPPVEGKANERVCEILADHFGLPKSRVQLVAGHKSKKKTFQIE